MTLVEQTFMDLAQTLDSNQLELVQKYVIAISNEIDELYERSTRNVQYIK